MVLDFSYKLPEYLENQLLWITRVKEKQIFKDWILDDKHSHFLREFLLGFRAVVIHNTVMEQLDKIVAGLFSLHTQLEELLMVFANFSNTRVDNFDMFRVAFYLEPHGSLALHVSFSIEHESRGNNS